MTGVAQFNTFGSGEFRVLPKHVDCVAHFVDDALSRRLLLAPEFKIFWSIVQAVAILVVNVFAFAKRAPENFRHHIAVRKNLLAAAQVKTPVPAGMHVPIWVYGAVLAAFVAALCRTKFLSVVVTGVPTVLGLAQAAGADFSTKLALKSRGHAVSHRDWLPFHKGYVKEFV